MKKFLRKVVQFLLFTVAFFVIQAVLFKVILSGKKITLDNNVSILILGDSQTETDLNPDYINNSANLSNSGDPLFFNYIKLRKVLETNNHIKTVILGFSPNNLSSKGFYEVPKMKSKFISYFFICDYKDFGKILKNNFKGFISGLTGLFRYFYKTNIILKTNDVNDLGIGGYREIPKPITTENLNKEITVLDQDYIDSLTVGYLDKIIQLCEEKKVKLILLNTPLHRKLSAKTIISKNNYVKFLKEKYQDHNFLYWDYEFFELKDHHFYDYNHLNITGAKIFSKKINQELKKIELN